MITDREFISAWKRWDHNSKDEVSAQKFEDACGQLALLVGRSTREVRNYLAARKREGRSYRESLSDLLAEIVVVG